MDYKYDAPQQNLLWEERLANKKTEVEVLWDLYWNRHVAIKNRLIEVCHEYLTLIDSYRITYSSGVLWCRLCGRTGKEEGFEKPGEMCCPRCGSIYFSGIDYLPEEYERTSNETQNYINTILAALNSEKLVGLGKVKLPELPVTTRSSTPE